MHRLAPIRTEAVDPDLPLDAAPDAGPAPADAATTRSGFPRTIWIAGFLSLLWTGLFLALLARLFEHPAGHALTALDLAGLSGGYFAPLCVIWTVSLVVVRLDPLAQRKAELAAGLSDGAQAVQAARMQMATLCQLLRSETERLDRLVDDAVDRFAWQANAASTSVDEAARTLTGSTTRLAEVQMALDQQPLAGRLESARRALENSLAQANDRLEALASRSEGAAATLSASAVQADAASLATQTAAVRLESQTGKLDDWQTQAIARFEALAGSIDLAMARLGTRGDALASVIDGAMGELEKLLSQTRQALDTQTEGLQAVVGATRTALEDALGQGQRQLGALGDDIRRLAETAQSGLLQDLDSGSERAQAMTQALAGLNQNAGDLTRRLDDSLAAATAQQDALADRARQTLAVITSLSDALAGADLPRVTDIDAAARSASVAMAAISEHAGAVLGTSSQLHGQMRDLEMRAARAKQTVEGASAQLATALASVDTQGEALAGALSQRIDELETASRRLMSQLRSEDEKLATVRGEAFRRASSLLIESLHSDSIDIGKAFGLDLTDADWKRYLAGDRSLFTRSVARALDSRVRADIAQRLDQDGEFREAVHRFIADFELLIGRMSGAADSEALSIALISSDLGRVYVALTQAAGKPR